MGADDQNQNYLSLSPGAAYDATRNKRSVARKMQKESQDNDAEDFMLNTKDNTKDTGSNF